VTKSTVDKKEATLLQNLNDKSVAASNDEKKGATVDVNVDKVPESTSKSDVGQTKVSSPPARPPSPPKELPQESVQNKNEGNELYKNGQYSEAYQKYTFAIHILMAGENKTIRLV